MTLNPAHAMLLQKKGGFMFFGARGEKHSALPMILAPIPTPLLQGYSEVTSHLPWVAHYSIVASHLCIKNSPKLYTRNILKCFTKILPSTNVFPLPNIGQVGSALLGIRRDKNNQ